jgi:phage terminase large subunit-like protein
MAYAVRAYRDAILDGSLSHDGHPVYEAHVGNAVRKELPGLRDEDGEPLWLIRKERPDSPKKIDLAMAGCLSWEARGDAIAAGALKVKRRRGGSV